MLIKFTASYQVQAAGGESYSAGDVVDLPDASAQHFIKRGAAEPFTGDAKPKAAKPKADAK